MFWAFVDLEEINYICDIRQRERHGKLAEALSLEELMPSMDRSIGQEPVTFRFD
jgi:hypothetical protein